MVVQNWCFAPPLKRTDAPQARYLNGSKDEGSENQTLFVARHTTG
jgi:hypothetical protein